MSMNENTYNALSALFTRPAAEEGDYTQDGLLHCGKCRTRREYHLQEGELDMIVPVMCDCEKAEYDLMVQKERERKAAQLRETTRANGLTDRRWLKSTFELDDRRDQTASDLCLKYARRFDKALELNSGLMLFGSVGSGKTYLAACIANAVIDQGYSVLMASMPGLIAQANADYGDGRQELMDRIRKVKLLILDDVGVERDTSYSQEQAYEIINARYRASLPLIVTTNISARDMAAEKNMARQRTFDRVIEMCQPVIVRGSRRRAGLSRALPEDE